MDEIRAPDNAPTLSASPATFEIVFADDPKNPLTLVSPPLADIDEMLELSQSAFSLKADGIHNEMFRASAETHLEGLLSKYERFKGSATFHNRLANLHSILGDANAEEQSASLAYSIGQTSIFARKVGEVAVRQGDFETARRVLLEAAKDDSLAALRLAAFSIKDRDIPGAKRWLDVAVDKNPAGYAERLFQGALLLIERRFEAAIGILKIAVDEKPNSSVAYSNLGFAYLGMNQASQAVRCLKRAVSLDPFNRSALLAYADVGARLGLDDDVISVLRYYIEFEQKDSPIWERLARSLLRVGLIEDSVLALKRQGAIRPTAGVWNNLGVAYARKKDYTKAMESFRQAVYSSGDGTITQDLVIAKNSAALVSSVGQFGQVIAITAHVVEQDSDYSLAFDDVISDIYSLHMNALVKLHRRREAFELAERLLSLDGISESLLGWIISAETAYRGTYRDDDDRLGILLDYFKGKISSSMKKDKAIMNNLAFAFAELGRVEEASHYLAFVSSHVHVDAYVTATMGLIHMKKGHVEKAEEMYKEAIHLAKTAFDKSRIRQKMNIELAKILLPSNYKKALRLLEKASVEKRGEDSLRKQALSLSKGLIGHQI